MILFEKFSPLETPLNSIWFLVEHCAFNISIKLLFYFFLKNLQTQLLNSGTYFFLQQTKINISKIKVSAKILCIETCTHYYIINPIQDGLFSGLLTDGRGAKRTPPKICHTSYNDETWHSYTLPKEDPKIYESRDTPLEFCWHQHFFTRNQQILLHQEIQI